jgi:hypothetical protein
MSCARIDISTNSDCSSWTNVSGSANSITGTEQTKMTGEEYTFDGNGALVEVGKYEPFDMVVRIVFTNQATEAYRLVREEFMSGACDGKMCIRYIPSGAVGGDGFQTNYAPITAFQWPEVNAGAAGPIMTQFTLRVSEIDPFVFVS